MHTGIGSKMQKPGTSNSVLEGLLSACYAEVLKEMDAESIDQMRKCPKESYVRDKGILDACPDGELPLLINQEWGSFWSREEYRNRLMNAKTRDVEPCDP